MGMCTLIVPLNVRLRVPENARSDGRSQPGRDETWEPSFRTGSISKRCMPLQVIDVQTVIDRCDDPWFNQTLCRVNDSVVRLAVLQGGYHWRTHQAEEEFFFVLEGRFMIDLEGRTIELAPRQGFTVPMGVMHRPRAPERAVVLMVERASIVPTG